MVGPDGGTVASRSQPLGSARAASALQRKRETQSWMTVMMLTVIKSQARLSSASTRKLTSEVRQPELKGSNNGNACEFDRRPNGDVDRIWALQAVPYATSPYRGRCTDPPRQPPLLVVLLERPGELVSKQELMAKV